MAFGLNLIERETVKKPWMEKYNFVLVQDIDHLARIVEEAIKAPYAAFDLESTGLDTRAFNGVSVNKVVGYSLAYEKDTCYYIPVRHQVETSRGKNLNLKKTNELIQKLLYEAVIVGHNWLKFDAEMMLASDNIHIKKFKSGENITYHDSYVLARLAGYRSAGLKALSKKLLDKEMIEITEVVASKSQIDFGSVSPYEGLIYAASDAICTKEIFEHPTIQQPIEDQKFVYNLERKVIYVVRNLERNKIKLNLDYCKILDEELSQKIDDCVKKSYDLVSEKTEGKIKEFKLDSPADVADILFNIFDMNPKPEKGKNGGYTTNDATLEKLASNYELAKVMQDYRMYTKFHRTYIKNMLNNADSEGYLKFQFSSLQTDTGRFASPGGGKNGDGCSGVNIQAIPARYDKTKPNIRKCLSCEDDEVMVAMDWAGVELRVATNMSLEPIWLDRFLNGDGDLHTSTASIIYDKSESAVEKVERQTGKTFNFQSVYGGGPGALASTIGISIEDAKEKQGRFFGRLQTLRNFIKNLQKNAQKNHFCVTKFGRKRFLPEYKSDNPKDRAGADRQSVNTPIQGTAADLMKLAMIKIDDFIEENNLRDYIKMVITMHDELCFRIKKSHIDVIPELEEVMKLGTTLQKIGWKVPLAVDVEIGSSWDVEYEMSDMMAYLKETYGISKLSFIYQKDQNYEEHLNKCSEWKKNKKEEKKKEEEKVELSDKDKLKEDFKKIGSSITKNIDEKSSLKDNTLESDNNSDDDLKNDLKIVSSKELESFNEINTNFSYEGENEGNITASANNLEKAFKIINHASLSDLPLEAHQKLKKSFYEEEIERILSGTPSTEDDGVDLPIVVHYPIDEMKKVYMGVILDTCKGSGRIKFVNQDLQDLSEDWFSADVLKAAVMAKIFNL